MPSACMPSDPADPMSTPLSPCGKSEVPAALPDRDRDLLARHYHRHFCPRGCPLLSTSGTLGSGQESLGEGPVTGLWQGTLLSPRPTILVPDFKSPNGNTLVKPERRPATPTERPGEPTLCYGGEREKRTGKIWCDWQAHRGGQKCLPLGYTPALPPSNTSGFPDQTQIGIWDLGGFAVCVCGLDGLGHLRTCRCSGPRWATS